MGKIIAGLIGWAVVIALGIPVALWNGYVLTVLWAWFLVPAGITALALKTAVGLNLIVGFLVANPVAAESDDKDDVPAAYKAFYRVIMAAFLGLGVLFTGWLYTLVL